MKCMMGGCNNEAVEVPSLYCVPLQLCEQCEERRLFRKTLAPSELALKMAAARIPKRYCVIKSGEPADQANKCADAAFNERKPLVLVGPTRSGKTLTLAVAAQRLLMRSTARFLFVNASALFKELGVLSAQKSLCRDSEYIMSVFPHLMLDDIGSGYDKSGWQTSALYRILDTRMNNGLPTWATMNDEQAVDARVLRRLTEDALVIKLKEVI